MFRRLLGLAPPDPDWFNSPLLPPSDRALELTYLGTAGFVLSAAERTVVLDPFVTRHPLGHLLGNKPLPSDPALVRRLIAKADDVLIGHAHFDHILDAPTLCQQTGARLVGSRATCMVGRAAGLPEAQLVETRAVKTLPAAPGRCAVCPRCMARHCSARSRCPATSPRHHPGRRACATCATVRC